MAIIKYHQVPQTLKCMKTTRAFRFSVISDCLAMPISSILSSIHQVI